MKTKTTLLFSTLLFCFIPLGCSNDNGLIQVSGSVSFNGEPIEDGSISFMPVDGKGVTGGGLITNGHYTAESSPGEMAVQIYGNKTVKKANPTKEEIERNLTEDKVQIVPAKFNRASELRISISADEYQHDFDLVE